MVTLSDFIAALPSKVHAKIVTEWEGVLEDDISPSPVLDRIVREFRSRNKFADSHTQTMQERVVFQCYRQISIKALGLTSD